MSSGPPLIMYYEIEMLTSTARGLAADISGTSVITNALIESCTIHARALLDFLYAEGPHKDDVIAEDFFEDPAPWYKARPPKSEKVQCVHGRVGKEIAHLTYTRQQVTPETKPWSLVDIAQEVMEVFAHFRRLVPVELLGSRWDV